MPEEQTNSQPHDPSVGSAETLERRGVWRGVPQQTALELHPDIASIPTKAKASKQPASTLIGARVIDSQSVPIGKISDLIVTAEPPEVQVIVELSGASESMTRLVAVPLPEFMVRSDEAADAPDRRIGSVETSLTISQLEVLPQFQY